MSKPFNEREIRRAARVIIDAYGAAAIQHALELELASPERLFAQAVRIKVEEILRPKTTE